MLTKFKLLLTLIISFLLSSIAFSADKGAPDNKNLQESVYWSLKYNFNWEAEGINVTNLQKKSPDLMDFSFNVTFVTEPESTIKLKYTCNGNLEHFGGPLFEGKGQSYDLTLSNCQTENTRFQNKQLTLDRVTY